MFQHGDYIFNLPPSDIYAVIPFSEVEVEEKSSATFFRKSNTEEYEIFGVLLSTSADDYALEFDSDAARSEFITKISAYLSGVAEVRSALAAANKSNKSSNTAKK